MSKRDTFVKNIKSITRSKSIQRALKGWQVVKLIELPPGAAHASCELCGTPFRSGAFLTHEGKNRARISVGGTCLETIQRARFADKKLIQRRKKTTVSTLEKRYFAIVDPGSWINWMVEHAPTRLAPIVSDLKFFDMVSTDADLEKLIRFHDKTRLYPTASLIPAAAHYPKLPREMSLDEARKFLKRPEQAVLRAITERAYGTYLQNQFRPVLASDEYCLSAWEALPELSRRMVVLLARLTELTLDGEFETIPTVFRPIAFPLRTPAFVCNKTFGLGYLDEQEQGFVWSGTKEVWLWSERDYKKFDLAYWQSVEPMSIESLHRAERAAFWSTPEWFTS